MDNDSASMKSDFTDDSSSSSSEDETDCQPQLRSLIRDKLLKSAFDKTPHNFVPERTIEGIITEDIIKRSLKITNPSNKENEVVEFVKTRAKKTFAIVVFSKQDDIMSVIRSLKRRGIDDSQLPIKNKERLGSKDWASDFYEDQWRFFAPIFSTDNYNYDLEECHILPFVSKDMDSGRGSFGMVSKYLVHQNHLLPVSSHENMGFLRSDH